MRLTCTRPVPAHLKHTTVLVLVVVVVMALAAGMVVEVVDNARDVALEAIGARVE